MNRPKLLDLFCGAGGASVGYYLAGLDVTGVDIHPQPRYPFPFIQMDALEADLTDFQFVHASPPCQQWSPATISRGNPDDWPDLIEPIRQKLRASHCIYVIENVPEAPLNVEITLCGVSFPELRVIRHRAFESNVRLREPEHYPHPLVYTFDKRRKQYQQLDPYESYVTVTGGGQCPTEVAEFAMGIGWMNKQELNESIPPAYTRYIGEQLPSFL